MIIGKMKTLWIVLGLWALSASAQAGTSFCLIPDKDADIRAVTWDTIKLSAEVTNFMGKTDKGKVTLKTPHKPYGFKTNIFIKYSEPYFGADASEYIVFSTGKEYRVIGVNYVFRNNKYHFSSLLGNFVATCRQ